MLNKTDKKNPFKVPSGYFEDFHTNMMSRIAEEPKTKVVPLWKKIVPWASIAAVLGGVILSLGILTDNGETRLTVNNNKISDIVVTENNLSSFDEEEFYLFLEDEVTRDSYYNLMVYQ